MASIKARVFTEELPLSTETLQINPKNIIYVLMILTILMFIKKLTAAACRRCGPSLSAKHE
jgi:hypothetical protein